MKRTYLIVAAILTISILGGCGSSADSSKAETAETAETVETVETTESAEIPYLNEADAGIIDESGTVVAKVGIMRDEIEKFTGAPDVSDSTRIQTYKNSLKIEYGYTDKIMKDSTTKFTSQDLRDNQISWVINIIGDKYKTARGITVGATKDDVLKAYGEPYFKVKTEEGELIDIEPTLSGEEANGMNYFMQYFSESEYREIALTYGVMITTVGDIVTNVNVFSETQKLGGEPPQTE